MPRIVALVVCLLVACQRAPEQDKQSKPSTMTTDAGGVAGPLSSREDAGSAVDAGPAAEFVGTVRGVVRLAKGAKLPLAPAPMVAGQPASSVAPCPPVDLHDQRTIAHSSATGGLSPVHLAITEMRAAPPQAPRTHELYIDACRLRPTLLGVMRGDTVRITNRSTTPLLPVLPGDKFMKGMLHGESREFHLERLGPIYVRCNFASYCGESLVVTVSHPLYTVTDGDGRFTIERVPLGETLKLHAFHPLFDVTMVTVALSRDAPEREVELTLTPKVSPPDQRAKTSPRR